MKLILLSSALLLVACQAQHDETSTAMVAEQKPVAQSTYQKPGAAITLHHEWLQKPSVGVPGILRVELKGSGLSSAMKLDVTGEKSMMVSKMTSSNTATQKIRADNVFEYQVTPAEKGEQFINVFVTTGEGEEKRGRAFAIPVFEVSTEDLKHPHLVEKNGEKIIEFPAQ